LDDRDDKPFKPLIHYNVGGNSKMHALHCSVSVKAILNRCNIMGGASPEWPFKYDAYQPYYTMANVYKVYSAEPTDGRFRGTILRSWKFCRWFTGIIVLKM
jgi:choline dehydrogenase-like flavoprotein